jgi:hypothetical protein
MRLSAVRTLRAASAAVLAASCLTLAGPAGPAAAQVTTPTLSIAPTSGPIGTLITATITGCTPPAPVPGGNPSARLDWDLGGTPANTVSFTPAADGTATVTIEALEKFSFDGPESWRGTGRVVVSQCGNEGFATASFVIQQVQRFPDVPRSYAHAVGIEWAAAEGIALGFGDGTYRPGGAVTRGQMASLLDRALDLPDAPASVRFSDVPPNSTHAGAIRRLAHAGIALGYGGGTFGPNDPVTRGQVSTFLDRALPWPNAPAPDFTDVPSTHTHRRGIANAAGVGVVEGYADGTFRPEAAVTRGQLATLLYRAVG